MFKLIAQPQHSKCPFLSLGQDMQKGVIQLSSPKVLETLYTATNLKPLVHQELRDRIRDLVYPENILLDRELLNTYKALLALDTALKEREISKETNATPTSFVTRLLTHPFSTYSTQLKRTIRDHIKDIPIYRAVEHSSPSSDLSNTLKMIELLVMCHELVPKELISLVKSESAYTEAQILCTCQTFLNDRTLTKNDHLKTLLFQLSQKLYIPETKTHLDTLISDRFDPSKGIEN